MGCKDQNTTSPTEQDDGWAQSSGRPINIPGVSASNVEKAGKGVGKYIGIFLKSMWWCIKLLGRFSWYMANMIFVVSKRRSIMDSDKSDVVKMQEMNNFRDSVDKTGFIDKDDMLWTKNEGSRKKF